jgi:Sec-independent protein translocase protein TatA
VFEGLFSPAHLAIVALIVFVVFGPRKLMRPFQAAAERVRVLGEDEPDAAQAAETPSPATAEPPKSLAYRLARRLRRGG